MLPPFLNLHCLGPAKWPTLLRGAILCGGLFGEMHD